MARSYNPFNGVRDKYNYEVDPSASFDYRYQELGCIWRLSTARAAIPDTNKQTISFTTPAVTVARCFINRTKVIMYGNVIDFAIVENPTLSGGSDATPLNASRAWSATPDSGCPLLTPKTACTYTGGTVIYKEFLGGGTNPATKNIGDTSTDSWLELKPGTPYLVELTAVGAVTWAQLLMRIACLVEQE